jgi:hypothetical protein
MPVMSGVPAAANSAGQSKAPPDTVKITISVQLKEFNSVAELEEKLRPHLLYDLPGAEYTVELEIPAPQLKRLVEGFFTFPKSQNDKDDYRNCITKYLQSVFGDELTTFVCTDDGSEQEFEGEALVYMTRKQAGENARLAAKFKQVLAATEGDEETRRLLSQFLEGGTAEVLARLSDAAPVTPKNCGA